MPGGGIDLIEPLGFLLSDRRLQRAGMDYLESADIRRHPSWDGFRAATGERRLVLLTTKGATPYTGFAFAPGDTLMVGRESAGAPDFVHDAAVARLIIPMAAGMRSLNVATAAAMVLGEALRQTNSFERDDAPDIV